MRLSQAKGMAEKPKVKAQKRKKRDETASVVAQMANCSAANVRMVMAGDVENEKILAATIMYRQGKSELIKHIEQIVQFN